VAPWGFVASDAYVLDLGRGAQPQAIGQVSRRAPPALPFPV
jgi:hypothetical protein